MKFATFENTVELIYKKVIPTPKEECSEPVQLGVSFAGGYIAGIFCAVISHPADNLVSFLNNSKGATVSDVSKTTCKSECCSLKHMRCSDLFLISFLCYRQ